ncbi:MarR family winged helix-turn-helix transcriptional regulator [Actinospica robiniae]|uniref:MarR family winged helix-turn-helix transcriptional regulator n=1 Tax=Actinospica robiniae TaxID=304901 RepID=UPI0003FAEF4F|nr:MarR family transcriptional regulator [Actinospica robiniae]
MDERDEGRPATSTAHADGDVEVGAVAADLRLVVVQLLRRLREQAPGSDLTKSQSTVLGLLETLGSATATELAKAQGMRPQSMAAIVAALQSFGLVAGAPDPRDGRKTVLSLTEKAREEFRTGRLAKEDWLTSALVATLTPEQIAQVAEVVPLLRRLGQA